MNGEYNPPIDISHTQREKPFRTKHTIKNPSFLVIDKISIDYITNHNKKYYFFLIKCDFKLIFNNKFLKPIHIETGFHHNTRLNILKRFLLYQIVNFIEKGQIFSHIREMIITTVNDKMYMTYDNYIQHPMQAVELNLNMSIAINPHLINSLKRSHIHPLIQKLSYINTVKLFYKSLQIILSK